MKRMWAIAPWLAGFGCAAALVGLSCLFVALGRPPAGAPAEQERLVTAIQTFRDRHGRLPESLQEAGIEFDRSLFDNVTYSKATVNPNAFTLTCTKDHTLPIPGTHWWYYQSEQGGWEYTHESI